MTQGQCVKGFHRIMDEMPSSNLRPEVRTNDNVNAESKNISSSHNETCKVGVSSGGADVDFTLDQRGRPERGA